MIKSDIHKNHAILIDLSTPGSALDQVISLLLVETQKRVSTTSAKTNKAGPPKVIYKRN